MAGRIPRVVQYAFSRHAGKLSLLAVSTAFTVGVVVGRQDAFASGKDQHSAPLCVPQFTLTDQQSLLPGVLRQIVGPGHVSENVLQQGSRMGLGTAMAVATPGTLQEAVDVLRACVKAGVVVIPQGANTGLTGGSVPRDKLCDRPVVVINMRRLNAIVPICKGEKVLCLAGAGILDLGQKLKNLGREAHSVLGSVFLNPAVAAGVAFGSGGTQIRKGPAYTERALYCRITAQGEVEVVDELGILSKDTEDLFQKIHSGKLRDEDIDPACQRQASDTGYRSQVCRFDSTVSRFNADTKGPDPCRCEGKVLILATVHDTFPIPQRTQINWVSCKDFDTAQALKCQVFLKNPAALPTLVEYMDRDTVDVVDSAGRGFTTTINTLGMGSLGALWGLKLQIQALPLPLADRICDLFLWYTNNLLPNPLTPPLAALAKRYDHHLLVEMPEFGNGEIHDIETRFLDWVKQQPAGTVEWHTCTPEEKGWAMVFRFVTAAAFKTYCIGKRLEGLSLDYSLPKNEMAAPIIPDPKPLIRMRYSHFGCNVVHEDLAYPAGVDVHDAKFGIKKVVEHMKGKLPAEHGHGTEYTAPPDAQARWKRMDPTNTMNPGVGGLSYLRGYR
eukprot:EG_transcript_5401